MRGTNSDGQRIVFTVAMLTSMILAAGCMVDNAEQTPTEEDWADEDLTQWADEVLTERAAQADSFEQCGLTCPDGWHVVATWCSNNCPRPWDCPGADNASRCEKH